MSHLIIEQGKDVGTEVEVPAAGMKFGRSPANDLVLDDESVMLFHGRLFFKSDGSLWVTDFGAGEKTMVGGKQIDEIALKVGDLVEVGSYAFRVINVQSSAAAAAPVPAAAKKEADAEEPAIDLGFQSPEKEAPPRAAGGSGEKNHSVLHRVLQAAIVLLVILVAALAVPEVMNLRGGSAAPQAERDKLLAFTYECVRGNYKDIFRYFIELTPEGGASIEIHNLGNRQNTKSAKVSAEAAEKLARRLLGSGFFEVDGAYEIDAPGTYNYYDLAIYCGGKFNRVKVLNRELPQDVQHAASMIEEFIFAELDVPSTLLEDEGTLVSLAAESLKLADACFAEQDVKVGNLAQAIKYYTEGLDYLETLDLKPAVYGRIKEGLARAQAEQDARYKDYKFNADRAMRLGDWGEADRQLRVLAELIPNRDDHRHEVIVAKQLEVEEHLR